MSQSATDRVPHEFPFRLVERAKTAGGARIGIVLGTANGALTHLGEWPCTLVAEALAQAVLVTAPVSVGTPKLVAIDRARLLRPISAGDALEVEAEEIGSFGGLRRYRCIARAAGTLAATVELTVAG